MVINWLPGLITGQYADSGNGKTLLMMQLQTCTALSKPWLGLATTQMKSLGVYCEDSLDELHRRQDSINRYYGCEFSDLVDVHWLSRFGDDNMLCRFDKSGSMVLSDLTKQITVVCRENAIKLVIIDTVADTFPGNENDRGQVRQYVQSALGYIAREIEGTVIACAHPSRLGMSSGTGDSGSTG